MALARIQQEDEEEEARRRRRYPKPAPQPEALAIGPGQAPRPRPFRRRVVRCRCLDDSIIEVEEGERCPPGCNPITQGEPLAVAPFIFTIGFLGLVAFLVAKRPFG